MHGQYKYRTGTGNGRDTTTKLAINQTNLVWNFATGFIDTALVTGVEVSRETVDRTNFSNNLDLSPVYDLDNPPGYYRGPRNKTNYLDSGCRADRPGAVCVRHPGPERAVGPVPGGALGRVDEGNNDTHTIATGSDVTSWSRPTRC